MKRRFLSIVVTLSMLVTLFQGGIVHASGYDRTAAVNYAVNHWNDGVGLCADFVSACMRAGGVPVSQGITSDLKNYLENNGYAKAYYLTSNVKVNLKINGFEGIIEPGDALINYCHNCGVYPHVVLVGGIDSSGYIRQYAHNGAKNNAKFWLGFDGYPRH